MLISRKTNTPSKYDVTTESLGVAAIYWTMRAWVAGSGCYVAELPAEKLGSSYCVSVTMR